MRRFSPLFQDSGNWREDCIPLKVPNRLKETVYGARLGLLPGTSVTETDEIPLSPALGRTDYSAILKCLFLTQASADEKALLNAMPAADFAEAVTGTVLAGRKATALDKQLNAFYADRDEQPDVTSVETSVTVVESFRTEARPIVTGTANRVGLLEELPDDVQAAFASVGGTLQGLPSSVFSKSKTASDRRVRLEPFHFYLENGTYPKEFRDELIAIAKQIAVTQLTPRHEIESEIAQAQSVSTSGFYVSDYSTPLTLQKNLEHQQYFTADEVSHIQALAAGLPILQEVTERWKEDTAKLKTRMRDLYSTLVYRGERTDTGSITLEAFYPIADNRERYLKKIGAVTIQDPSELKKILDLLDTRISSGQFMPLETIPNEWKERAAALCSKEGAHLLSHPVDSATYQAGRRILKANSGFVARDFYELVNEIAPNSASLEKTFILPTAAQGQLQAGGAYVSFLFGGNKNVPILQVALEKPSYMTNFIANGNFPEIVKKICAAAHSIAQRDLKPVAQGGSWNKAPEYARNNAEQQLRARIEELTK
jgi:hypothetical protein